MANLAFTNSNIFGYQDIPYQYPVLWGSPVTEVKVKHSDRPVVGGFVPAAAGTYVTWKYPLVEPSVVDDFLRQAAAVAYEVSVLAGSVTENQLRDWALDPSTPPSAVLSTTIENYRLPDPYYPLSRIARGRLVLPTTGLEEGQTYTVAIRALMFFTTEMDLLPPDQVDLVHSTSNFYYSEYGFSTLTVNAPPTVANLRVNGLVNPTRLKSTSNVDFSFSLVDADGPYSLYRIQVGTTAGLGFSANIWDSGLVKVPVPGPGGVVEASLRYSGAELDTAVEYAWRVGVDDGFSGVSYTEATDTFQLNAPPQVTAVTADGSDIIDGVPQVGNENVEIAWTYTDADGDPQAAYSISIGQANTDVLVSGEVPSSVGSIVVPSLPPNELVHVSISVSDGTEFGEPLEFDIMTNAKPVVGKLLVDGEVDPGDVANATPTFSWTTTDNAGGAIVGGIQTSFQVEVSADDDFETLLWDSGTVETGASSIVYGSVGVAESLSHGTLYHVRVRASDGISFSDYATGFFSVNTAPTAPVLVAPSSGSYSGTMEVQWLGSTDADGDEVNYVLEITDQATFNKGWKFLAGPLSSTQLTFDLDLDEIKSGNNYAVRVVASDGFSQSDYAVSPRFTILNHAPNTPVFSAPTADSTFNTTIKVEWIEATPVDVDGDAVIYFLEMTRSASSESPIWESLGVFREGSDRFFINARDFANGTDYRLRIKAVDSRGAEGQYVYSEVFTVSNVPYMTDFERLNSRLYASSSDGRFFRVVETVWQVDEQWDDERDLEKYEEYVNGTAVISRNGGFLVFSAPPGSTCMLRQSGSRE